MEIEKRKRKREIIDHQEDHPRVVGSNEKKAMLRGKDQEQQGEEGEVKAPPSEEEVEEFFAILKRMHEAVKYFNRRGRQGGEDRRWNTALEALPVARVNGEVDNHIDDNKGIIASVEEDNNKEVEEARGGELLLDLNSSPRDGHDHD